MRCVYAIANDIRYQMKYGFYFLYGFISVIYVAVLFVTPAAYKEAVASIIILTDPAMLGMFFIGGIWLLEKEESLHRFLCVSPLRVLEYVTAKAVSLALISTLSAGLIVLMGLGTSVRYLFLLSSVFIGSLIFTTIGLVVASYARSVNNYLVIGTPVAILLSTPPILLAFGFSFPAFEILPGTALWRIIGFSIQMTNRMGIGLWFLLAIWLGIAMVLASVRIPVAMQMENGGG